MLSHQALQLNLAFCRQNIFIAHRRTVRPLKISLESSIHSNRYSTINQFISKAEQAADGLKSSRFFIKITANGWGCEPWGSSWRSVVIRRQGSPRAGSAAPRSSHPPHGLHPLLCTVVNCLSILFLSKFSAPYKLLFLGRTAVLPSFLADAVAVFCSCEFSFRDYQG